MIERFQGAEGKKRLIAALRLQKIVQDEQDIATAIAEVAEVIQVDPNTTRSDFIRQNDSANEIYLILSGRASIRVNGQELAIRETGNHVGEMALIDTTARRSATVAATVQTVLARISEPDFSAIAEKYPQLWRRLALELASRLRERNKHVKTPNQIPKLFIGSSSESLTIAQAIQLGLDHENLEVKVWTDGVFRASNFAIEDLMKAVESSDFAILILSPDDKVTSRGKRESAPRDNVIFELGLFMGALGRERTFVVKPRSQKIKGTSDLLGLSPVEYASEESRSLESRIAPVCNTIRKVINELGPK